MHFELIELCRFNIQAIANERLSSSAISIVAKMENNGNLVAERYVAISILSTILCYFFVCVFTDEIIICYFED